MKKLVKNIVKSVLSNHRLWFDLLIVSNYCGGQFTRITRTFRVASVRMLPFFIYAIVQPNCYHFFIIRNTEMYFYTVSSLFNYSSTIKPQ